MFSDTIDFLKKQEVEYAENKDYSKKSYMKSGGVSALSAAPDSILKLTRIIQYLRTVNIRYKVVGRMSNTMLDEGVYQGVIIETHKLDRKNVAENTIKVECGARLSRTLWDMARRGYGGAEELMMIPGTVGGALYNNAGAHGKSISDFVSCADVYFPDCDEVRNLSICELNLGYRDSIFKSSGAILLSCVLKLSFDAYTSIFLRAEGFARKRRALQPLEYPSLGSVFMRCNGIGPGYYIEQSGLKGYRIGGAEISRKHAGFIINTGNATPADIKKLIEHARSVVKDRFNVDLKEEIEIIR